MTNVNVYNTEELISVISQGILPVSQAAGSCVTQEIVVVTSALRIGTTVVVGEYSHQSWQT